jgi:hypothetical protein
LRSGQLNQDDIELIRALPKQVRFCSIARIRVAAINLPSAKSAFAGNVRADRFRSRYVESAKTGICASAMSESFGMLVRIDQRR